MYINASLMHEIRMIAQQFLRSKESMSFWESRKPKAKPAPTMQCLACLLHRDKVVPAVATHHGNSVCKDHLAYS